MRPRPEPGVVGIPRSADAASFSIDLPLEPRDLNERLFDIGLWLMEREIPHQARVVMEPEHRRIRVSLPNAKEAMAFGTQFGLRVS